MEEWRKIPELPGYEVSNTGKVRNKKTKDILKLMRRRGYPAVNIKMVGGNLVTPIHQLVCRSWHGLPKKYRTKRGTIAEQQVRHLDDNKNNNSPENLRWGTSQENSMDMFLNGRKKKRRYSKELISLIQNSVITKKLRKEHKLGIRSVSLIRKGRVNGEGELIY